MASRRTRNTVAPGAVIENAYSGRYWTKHDLPSTQGTTGLEDEGPYPGFVALEGRVVGGKTMLSQFENVLLKRSVLSQRRVAYISTAVLVESARSSPSVVSDDDLAQG